MWVNSYDRLTTDLRPFIKTYADLYNQGIKVHYQITVINAYKGL